MSLSTLARQMIGNQCPVAFAASQLGYASPTAFLEKMAEGHVNPDTVPCYIGAFEEKKLIPFFAVGSIEDAAAKKAKQYIGPDDGLKAQQRAVQAAAPPPKKRKTRDRLYGNRGH